MSSFILALTLVAFHFLCLFLPCYRHEYQDMRLGLCRRLRVSYWWLVRDSLAAVKVSWSYSIRYLLIDWHAWDTFTFTPTHAWVCWRLELLLNSTSQVILFCSLNRPLRVCHRNHSEHRQLDITFPVMSIPREQCILRTALMRGTIS